MNQALAELAAAAELAQPSQQALRLAFGLACVERVAHLLEDPRAVAGLEVLRRYVAGAAERAALDAAAVELQAVARSHHGSPSLDGSAHAAVSATYAVANALAGRALEAAGYAAYASVYAYGGYAVSDPAAFAPEYAWQVQTLKQLLSGTGP